MVAADKWLEKSFRASLVTTVIHRFWPPNLAVFIAVDGIGQRIDHQGRQGDLVSRFAILGYTLWLFNIAMENHAYNRQIHYKWAIFHGYVK